MEGKRFSASEHPFTSKGLVHGLIEGASIEVATVEGAGLIASVLNELDAKATLLEGALKRAEEISNLREFERGPSISRVCQYLVMLSTPEQHQKKIAIATLRMSDVGARIMGGMTKDEARAYLAKIGWSAKRIAAL